MRPESGRFPDVILRTGHARDKRGIASIPHLGKKRHVCTQSPSAATICFTLCQVCRLIIPTGSQLEQCNADLHHTKVLSFQQKKETEGDEQIFL
jgi:hypothetical protein